MNGTVKSTKAKGCLIASGVLDILLTLCFLAGTIFAALLFVALMALTGASGELEGGAQAAYNLSIGLVGGLGAGLTAIVGVILLVIFIFSVIVTVKTFKLSAMPVDAAKRKTSFLITFGVLQVIVGAIFLFSIATMLEEPEMGSSIAITVVIALIAFADGILKFVSSSLIRRERVEVPENFANNYGAPENFGYGEGNNYNSANANAHPFDEIYGDDSGAQNDETDFFDK